MLGEALSYPRTAENWLKTILIGGVLLLFSWLLIPLFLLYGYTVRVLRSAARDEETAPSFGNWGALLVDGLKVLGITLGYLIIPYVLIFGALGVGTTPTGDISVVGWVLLLVGYGLLFGAGYLVPVALTNFALTDSMGAAFDFREVVGAAATKQYLIAFLLVIGLGFVFSLLGGLLAIILVGLFILFYGQVVMYYLLARGCAPGLTATQSSSATADL